MVDKQREELLDQKANEAKLDLDGLTAYEQNKVCEIYQSLRTKYLNLGFVWNVSVLNATNKVNDFIRLLRCFKRSYK